jgi:hypothetical protein
MAHTGGFYKQTKKNINMKQLLSLFLFLVPCLAWAQYPSNGNQKITLGEQTTADGLIFRGVAADTTLTAKSDTAAYFVLDTVNINLYTYKASATGRKWRQLGVDTASIAYVNTYGTQTVAGEKTFNNNIKFKDVSNGFTIAQGTGGNTGYSGFWHNSVNLDQTKYNLITNGSTLLLNSQTTISLAINDSGKLNARSFGADVVGSFGIGNNPPTARLHIAAGTATASTAPLKFESGTNLTTAEAGAMEFNGTNLFFSPSTTRHTVNHGLTGSATLNFPSTTTLLSADLTITVTGAADGDVVSLGVPNAAVNANTSYSAWVSAANTVTVRFNNYSSGTVDPASALFKVFVTK